MKILIFTLVLFFSINNFAEEKKVFNGFWENASESFTKNTSYHLAAIALTPVLIHSDVDANIHTAFQGNRTHLFDPGDALGYIGPLVLGIPLYT